MRTGLAGLAGLAGLGPISPCLPTVKTTSGATAVQILHSQRGSRGIEHVGSAHDEAEPEAAEALVMSGDHVPEASRVHGRPGGHLTGLRFGQVRSGRWRGTRSRPRDSAPREPGRRLPIRKRRTKGTGRVVVCVHGMPPVGCSLVLSGCLDGFPHGCVHRDASSEAVAPATRSPINMISL